MRDELAEDVTARALGLCVPLREKDATPEHVRALTSRHVLDVEADLVARTGCARRAARNAGDGHAHIDALDTGQRAAVAALTGEAHLVVLEGAAGVGKTNTLASARDALATQGSRLVVVTPTLKAAQAASDQIGAHAGSAAWLAFQHGWRWDSDRPLDSTWSRRGRPSDGPGLRRPESGGATARGRCPASRRGRDAGPGHRQRAADNRRRARRAARAGRRSASAARGRPRRGARPCAPVGRPDSLRQSRGGAPVHPRVHHRRGPSDPRAGPVYALLSLQMRQGENPAKVFDALDARRQIATARQRARPYAGDRWRGPRRATERPDDRRHCGYSRAGRRAQQRRSATG